MQANSQHYGATLLLFSFVYGILHAGRSRLRQSGDYHLSCHPPFPAAALLQGTMAIMLVTPTLNLLRLSSCTLHLSQFWLEKASFVLVGGLGVWLCWRGIRRRFSGH